jgi:type IV secretory pathway VirB10-like protein
MDLFKNSLIVFCVATTFAANARAAQSYPRDPVFFDRSFVKEAPAPWQGVTKKAERKTSYFLPTGFVIPAHLENQIVSYNVASPCIATVERDVVYLSSVVIPTGTRLIGTVSVEQSHDRILVNFNDIVFPTGDEVRFSGMALSLDGSSGIEGKVQTYKDSAVANTVLRSFITGTQSALMYSGISPIATGATQGLTGEATKELDTQRQQVTTSITVEAQTGLQVYLNQRLEF